MDLLIKILGTISLSLLTIAVLVLCLTAVFPEILFLVTALVVVAGIFAALFILSVFMYILWN